MFRVCTQCKNELPVEKFETVKKKDKEYFRGICRDCRMAKNRQWRADNKQLVHLADIKKYAKSLGFDEVESKKIEDQFLQHDGKCEICHQEGVRRLAVDHCHSKNIFRGFLCHNCNLMLGHAKDSRKILAAGIAYLERHQN